jgi:TetR/AcrR family transcriptional regulator
MRPIAKTADKQAVSTVADIAILQGALDEFAAHGFAGATTRGIAARVGLSHGLIRYYYETKEKLWLAAVGYLFERIESEIALSPDDWQRLAEGDIHMFRLWLKSYVRYCARHPEHARIIYQESVTRSLRLEYVVAQHTHPTQLAGLASLESLRAQGVFPKNAPLASIIYIISGAAQNIFALAEECRLSLSYDPLSDAAIEAHADTVADMLCPLPKK